MPISSPPLPIFNSAPVTDPLFNITLGLSDTPLAFNVMSLANISPLELIIDAVIDCWNVIESPTVMGELPAK